MLLSPLEHATLDAERVCVCACVDVFGPDARRDFSTALRYKLMRRDMLNEREESGEEMQVQQWQQQPLATPRPFRSTCRCCCSCSCRCWRLWPSSLPGLSPPPLPLLIPSPLPPTVSPSSPTLLLLRP